MRISQRALRSIIREAIKEQVDTSQTPPGDDEMDAGKEASTAPNQYEIMYLAQSINNIAKADLDDAKKVELQKDAALRLLKLLE